MIFKGYKFRENKNLIMLPTHDEDKNVMPYVEDGHENYVYFGKILKQNEKKPVNAIKTTYKWNDTGENVYAIPVDLNGHSLTNMAYGTKNQIYLAFKGRCYQAKINKI